jgi:hypothetical protein
MIHTAVTFMSTCPLLLIAGRLTCRVDAEVDS